MFVLPVPAASQKVNDTSDDSGAELGTPSVSVSKPPPTGHAAPLTPFVPFVPFVPLLPFMPGSPGSPAGPAGPDVPLSPHAPMAAHSATAEIVFFMVRHHRDRG